jgi:hypothetical protein
VEKVQINSRKQETNPVSKGIDGKMPLTEAPRRSTALPIHVCKERRFDALPKSEQAEPRTKPAPKTVSDKDVLETLSNAKVPNMQSLLRQIAKSSGSAQIRRAARKALSKKDEISSLKNE